MQTIHIFSIALGELINSPQNVHKVIRRPTQDQKIWANSNTKYVDNTKTTKTLKLNEN